MIKARTDNENWVRCGKCGHKFMKVVNDGYCDISSIPPIVEIKCHSCKAINAWTFDFWKAPHLLTDEDERSEQV